MVQHIEYYFSCIRLSSAQAISLFSALSGTNKRLYWPVIKISISTVQKSLVPYHVVSGSFYSLEIRKPVCLIWFCNVWVKCMMCHLVSAPDPDRGRLLLLAWWVMARTAMPRHSFSISWSSASLWGIRSGASPLRKSYCPYRHKHTTIDLNSITYTFTLLWITFIHSKPPEKQITWNLTIKKQIC